MFQHGRGPMFDWLARNERDMSDCGHGSPIEHLERCGLLGENLLAAHANYLAPGDADRLARAQTSVVHCPRSHAYFGHQAFPGAALTAAGVNVCLGTDSLASVKKITGEPLELNLFAEMRTRSAAAPGLSPETIVRQATLHGARALGRAGELGELTADARADLIALPFAGKPADAAAAVVHHPGAVTASLIDGRWAIAPA